jgi:hypothetical protein
MNRTRRLAAVFALGLVASVGTGCTYYPSLASDAVAYNEAVEDSQNRILLLNVVRAAQRRPMHFSELSKITGKTTETLQLGLAFPFGRGASMRDSAATLASIAGGPTYDVGVLATKEFISGIMTPVNPSLFKYYWDQGYSRKVLLLLFVREIRLGGSTYENYPPDLKKFRDFVRKVEELLGENLTPVALMKPVKVAGPFSQIPLEAAIQAHAQKLTIVEEKGGYSLYRQEVEIHFEAKSQRVYEVMSLEGPALTETPLPTAPLLKSKKSEGAFVLRSPEAIAYFLGELAREQLGDAAFPIPTIRTRVNQSLVDLPLFSVRSGRTGASQLAVWTDATRYYVPSGDAGGRSQLCLALLSQLMALHKSRDLLPSTQTVNLIGNP